MLFNQEDTQVLKIKIPFCFNKLEKYSYKDEKCQVNRCFLQHYIKGKLLASFSEVALRKVLN